MGSIAMVCSFTLLAQAGLANAQVSLSAPAGGQTVSGTTPIAVSVSAGVSWVNFYIDGYAVASSPPYTISWNTTIELNGTHFVEVRAYNASGGLLGSDTATVRVSNATPAPTPVPPGYFRTLAPDAALPSEASCSSSVLSQPGSEGVPANSTANHTRPSAAELSAFHALPLWNGEAPIADFADVDGNFAGTTDQIIRWASCKWGLDENAMRAESWYETNWIQSTAADRRTDFADCHTPNWDGWDGTQCWQSYGIFQAKVFDFNIWPEDRDSTAFNSDFRGSYLRACLNGDVAYLARRTPKPGYPDYLSANPEYKFWGCMGEWASGGWFDVGGIEYVTFVRRTALKKPWPSVQTVKITQPSNGATVAGAVTIGTQMSAAVLWENIYIDSHYLASSPPSSFRWQSTQVANGTHTLSVKAYNNKNAQIGAAAISMKVAN
jgi:autotransporter family porin